MVELRMYVLYGGKFTRALLVQMVLDEGEIPYELREINILEGEHLGPTYRAINPAGLVPAMITPKGDVLHETPAIMMYLAERHGLTHLAPSWSDGDRGKFLNAVFFIANDIQPEMKRFFYPHRYSQRTTDNETVHSRAKESVFERFSVIEKRVAENGPFQLGETFSLADLYLCFWIATLDLEGSAQRFPALTRLYELTRARPKTRPHMIEAEDMIREYMNMQKATPSGVIP
jgi:glutathione S-transferase